ncbi:type IV pilus assembly protein PilN [Paraburkholderia sp. RAU2J]|uniref:fimbrial assembly protein n=1 Tax=Paraburkholderia sp. RAU2J TaxID=1938810 RepID=UPI000EB014DE|nr:fimbrial assembly protein [Paraburkholderia sp. RAU2J]RKT25264.1 type IV pilus assembly protein PilN [Paraburkholderia sp. RAU2J]
MTGGLSFSGAAGSRAAVSSRAARLTRPWLGGFNLMPYRQRNVRLARRRRACEWGAAVLAGCAAVLALAGWQAFGKARLDAQRASIERALAGLTVPLAEHATLLRERDELRKHAARATSLSEPLAHLLDLLETLSFEPGDGVVLRQLRQREHETELLATSRGHLASAEWLKRLSAIRGVKGAEMSDLHRPTTRGNSPADESVSGPVEFGARLRWDEPAPKAAHVAVSAAARPVKSERSGGVK